MKIYLTFLIYMLFCLPAYSQTKPHPDVINWKQAYLKPSVTISSATKTNRNVYLVTLSKDKNAFSELAKNDSIKILRRLSAEDVIIENNAVNKIAAIASALPASDNWKLSSNLINKINAADTNVQKLFWISSKKMDALDTVEQKDAAFLHIEERQRDSHLIIATTSLSFILKNIIPLDAITFVDLGSKVINVEAPLSDYNISANTVNLAHNNFYHINGDSINVSIKESLFDTTDIDFAGRYFSSKTADVVQTQHATSMATIIGGAGNSYYTGEGVAPHTNLTSTNANNLLPDNNLYKSYNISIQNHSYGTMIENFYGADAVAYDQSMLDNPSLMHVFSSGNSGTSKDTVKGNIYSVVDSMANITGSFKMAKNPLVVGALDTANNVHILSSRGPAYDGRVKPELIAYGQEGTSNAAALASGTVALLQNAYEKSNLNLPPSALVKAVLINSADVMKSGINYSSGYGNINAYRSLKNMTDHLFFDGAVRQGETKTFSLDVPANAINLKVTLVWNDLPANAGAFKALINDLDLQITTPANEKILPWVLNPYPDNDSLRVPAVRKRDSLNVVEQISLAKLQPGNYSIAITGYQIPNNNTQSFYIAYQWDTANTFQWTYPVKSDFIEQDTDLKLLWKNNFGNALGSLEYSTDGSSWQTIANNVDLSKQMFTWRTPKINSTAIVRMKINGYAYNSDSIYISSAPSLKTGYYCGDSALLFWNKQPGVDSFSVYSLNNKFLQSVVTTADTTLVLHNQNGVSQYYTVAPVIRKSRAGIKAYTLNPFASGNSCYIDNFLADLQFDNTAKLTLQLSFNSSIQTIIFEKKVLSSWNVLSSANANNSFNYFFVDTALNDGSNVYRTSIRLTNGIMISSIPSAVFYWNKKNYVVYPNPVRQGAGLQIAAKDPFNKTVVIINMVGAKLFQTAMNDSPANINLPLLQKGVYILLIYAGNRIDYSQKIVVQ